LVCLLSKCYSTALPIINEEIFEVNAEATTPRDFLLYYYYGGMVYTGLKQFKKALGFFRMVITAPAVVLSSIMVEAYKKYVLLSLICFGKVSSLPRHTSSVLQRHHKTSFPQYTDFVNAYSTNSTEEVHKVAGQHADVFQKDKNFGLVKQCIQRLYRNNIQKFTQTYLTLSLDDITKQVGLPNSKETESQILRMIDNGEIFATINQQTGMVSFQENPEQYDDNKMTTLIDKQIQNVIGVSQRVRLLDESVASSQQYIQKTAFGGHERGGRWGGGPGADFDDFPEGAEKPLMGKMM